MTKEKTILIKNIYYMLSYAFAILKQSIYDDIEKEEFDSIHNLFAAILARGINQQLKQGLYREYLDKQEDLPMLRGKIDVIGTARNKLSRKQQLSCEYDELSENNQLNRILKMTSLLLMHHNGVDSEKKDDLKRAMLFFSYVDNLEPNLVKWSSLQFQRSNQTYRMLISICQLVIEGLLLTTERGEHRLASFIDEQRMCRLFERFVFEYFIQEHPEIKTSASQIPWALDDGIGTMLPQMQSDVVLSRDNKMLIIDAKFYKRSTQNQYGIHTIHSNNLYQIFTYVKNMAARYINLDHEVAGMLLYAQTEDAIQPNKAYMMSGNCISVKTLDLNCEFKEIATQLDGIATSLLDDSDEVNNRTA